MKFYDISFMDVGDELRLEPRSSEGSTWIAVKTGPDEIRGVVNLHIREGHEDRLRSACDAFNAVLAEPVVVAIAAE